ncbi:MAG: serine aminopeptidase domain-containing protein [Myxococcaceae bacterium]
MFRSSSITTAHGTLWCREWGPRGNDATVLMVGGVGGGFSAPARELYTRLGDALPSESMSALHLQYRHPRELEQCVSDVLEGIRFLKNHGTGRVILIGHSLGGAVVVNAGLASPDVSGVIALSTQLGGMGEVRHLNVPVFFIHGTDDDVLPAACSVSAWRMASEPRRLELMDGAGHNLDEAADEVFDHVHRWILDQEAPPKETPIALPSRTA